MQSASGHKQYATTTANCVSLVLAFPVGQRALFRGWLEARTAPDQPADGDQGGGGGDAGGDGTIGMYDLVVCYGARVRIGQFIVLRISSSPINSRAGRAGRI